MLYDITRTVSPALVVWPGDTPYSARPLLSLDSGNSVNLTTLTMTPHLGTHADAYYHFVRDGVHPAKMPLDAYIGRAQVITVSKRDGALLPADLANYDLKHTERLLLHSHVSDLPDTQWAEEFPYLSVELIDSLAGLGVRLIGLDSPSVDAFDSTTLPCHHALRKHNMVNLESVYLRGVPDGEYELIALPLKLDLACGSPVRAVLRAIG
ncbi:MAG: cyclase family protein [Anaerolineae bacterium]|nr:cyclase family protein [Anaerolineae bacterium]